MYNEIIYPDEWQYACNHVKKILELLLKPNLNNTLVFIIMCELEDYIAKTYLNDLGFKYTTEDSFGLGRYFYVTIKRS